MGSILKIWTAVTPHISIVTDGEESGSQDVPLMYVEEAVTTVFLRVAELVCGTIQHVVTKLRVASCSCSP